MGPERPQRRDRADRLARAVISAGPKGPGGGSVISAWARPGRRRATPFYMAARWASLTGFDVTRDRIPLAQAADVFISYSREDKDKVLELAGKLRAAGVSLWIDQGGIDGATLWGEEIVNALEQRQGHAARRSRPRRRVRTMWPRKSCCSASARGTSCRCTWSRRRSRRPSSIRWRASSTSSITTVTPAENLKTILRSLERAGATIARSAETESAAAATSEERACCSQARATPRQRRASTGARRTRGAAVRQYQHRPGDRLLQRRTDRGTNCPTVAGQRDRTGLALGHRCSTRGASRTFTRSAASSARATSSAAACVASRTRCA